MDEIRAGIFVSSGKGCGIDRHGILSFGVEMEFLAPVVPQGQHDPHADQDDRRVSHESAGRRQGEHVFSALLRAPITICRRDAMYDGIPPNVWVFHRDDSLRLTVSDPLFATYKTDGCEVSSEILFSGDNTNDTKIRAVCGAIRSERVLLNDTTGVHIHVGRGTLGFSLVTIKKLTSLLWLVDEPLMCLQHPSRMGNVYCQMISMYSNLAVEAPRDPLPDDLCPVGLQEMAEHIPELCRGPYGLHMTRIWGARSIDELRKSTFIHDSPYTVRGSVTYQKLGFGEQNTVEFRQMGGSLEPEAIMIWTRVCVALMDFVRKADAPAFRFMMADMMGSMLDPLHCALELLRKLGLSEADRNYYFSKHQEYHIQRDLTYFNGQDRGEFVSPLPNDS